MKIEIGSVWISNDGLALIIIEDMHDGFYRHDNINKYCDNYISANDLKRGFTKLESEA